MPLSFEGGRASVRYVPEGSAAQQVQALLPGATVVSAFHNLSAQTLLKGGALECRCRSLRRRRDRQAAIMKLVEGIDGTRAVDAGPLANAQIVEDITALLVSINRKLQDPRRCPDRGVA